MRMGIFQRSALDYLALHHSGIILIPFKEFDRFILSQPALLSCTVKQLQTHKISSERDNE